MNNDALSMDDGWLIILNSNEFERFWFESCWRNCSKMMLQKSTCIVTRLCVCIYTIRGGGYDKKLSFGGTNDEPTQLFRFLYHPLIHACHKHRHAWEIFKYTKNKIIICEYSKVITLYYSNEKHGCICMIYASFTSYYYIHLWIHYVCNLRALYLIFRYKLLMHLVVISLCYLLYL